MTRFLAPAASEPPRAAAPPRFSVVIPAYEAAETIAEAVESALDQTYPPEEVIVCDDGSRDDPAAALAPYRDRIVLVHQENAGASAARNTAIERASGDWVVGLDADDLLARESLAARAELIGSRPDLDIVCTNADVVLDGQVLRRMYRPDWPFETEDQRKEILRRCFITFWAARRTKLLAIGGFDPAIRNAEDWDIWIRMVLAGSRAGLVDEALATYRLRSGSQSNEPLGLFAGRIASLEKAIRSGGLSEEEKAVALAVIEEDRFEQRLAIATEALLARSPHARREQRRLLFSRDLPAPVRLRALAAWVSPAIARRVLAKRGRPTGAGVILPVE